MKHFISFILCFILFSCNQTAKETDVANEGLDTALIPVNADKFQKKRDLVNSDKDFIENIIPLELPAGFKIDSTFTKDKKHNTQLRLHYPISGNKALDNLVREKIEKSKTDYLTYIETSAKEDPVLLTYEGNYYNFKLISTTESVDILSYLFWEQGYVARMMNHSNYDYQSLNFDRNTNKKVRFSDVLTIQTTEGSTEFKNLINRTLNYNDVELDAVGPPEFILNGENIIFCFSPYEVTGFAFGGFQASVPKKVLRKWLKNL